MAMAFRRRQLRDRDADALARYIGRLLIPVLVVLLRMMDMNRWRRYGIRRRSPH